MAEKEANKIENKEKDGLITAIYKANLHCPECAREIKRPLLRTQGIHNVEINMEKGEIKTKGSFDPIVIQKRLEKITKRKIQLISPTVQIKETVLTEKKLVETKQVVTRTTSFKVHLHCDQCERDLKKTLLKKTGIFSVKTDMKAQILTVEGTMEAEKLVSFLRKKVNKHAVIIPPKAPENKDEKKETVTLIKEDITKTEIDKSTEKSVEIISSSSKEEIKIVEVKPKEGNSPYFIHYVYAPQLFSDENPNACTIS